MEEPNDGASSIRDFYLREDQRILAPQCCSGSGSFFFCCSGCCLFGLVVPVACLVLALTLSDWFGRLTSFILFGLSTSLLVLYLIWSFAPLCFRDSTPYEPVDALPRETSRHRKIDVKSIGVIVNPFGGMGASKDALQQANAVWQENGVKAEVHNTKRAGHDEQLGRELDTSAIDVLVCIGGDGTIHSVVNGMMQRPRSSRVPISCVPGGSGNSLMTDLQCLDIDKCARDQTLGRAYPISLAKLEFPSQSSRAVIYSMNTVAFGLVSNVGIVAESFRWMGTGRYDNLAVWEILKTSEFRAQGSADGVPFDEPMTTLFCNRTQHFGKGLRCCPTNTLQTNALQMFTVGHNPRATGLATLTHMASGAHARFPELAIRSVKRLELRFDEPGAFLIDGEVYQHDAGEMVITCKMDAIEFVI